MTASPRYPTLFSPLKLRHRTLRNRIVFGAHTVNMSDEGLPKQRHLGYYRERALGGAGMIVVEPSPPHATGILTRGNFRDYGVPFISLAEVHLTSWDEADCHLCRDNAPINTRYAHGADYLAQKAEK